jgi:S-DNA-T family DNA segregation ATPase FtsK/SpoIIIE
MAVPFREAFRVIEENTKDNLLLPIGKDINGKIVSFPLNDMPHLLVAGTTGSGKSVLVHCMIMTLIMRNYPSQLKLMLIDPKQVEFAKYNLEPHLFCPVISDANQAITALRKLCDEMDRRYKVLAQSGCVKMSEYRDKRKGHESTMEEIPDVVCIIDEFADLMQTGGDQVANYVQRISQKARAAGVYLIIATQRPSKDVIPMVIKSNIACRIGLSCSTRVDSQVVLDEPGAETLLGKGDLLFKCPGKKSLIRAQSPFISNKDMDTVLSYLKEKAGDPNYDPDFLDLEVKEDPDDGIPSSEDLYEQVKDFVMKTGIVSKSALMRNLSLTYTKADQFLGRLRQEGIVVMSGGKNVVVKRESMED